MEQVLSVLARDSCDTVPFVPMWSWIIRPTYPDFFLAPHVFRLKISAVAWNDEAFLGAASYPASWWHRVAVYQSAEGSDKIAVIATIATIAVIATIAILRIFSLGYLYYRWYRYIGSHCYISGIPS